MAIFVDISDRMYDYTDEEKAAEAIEGFQDTSGLSDTQILALWTGAPCPQRDELERIIFEAVDRNGSAQRANETIPGGLSLYIDSEPK